MDRKRAREFVARAPVAFLATEIGDVTGGAISPTYAALLRSRGEGPEFHKLGRRVVYRRDELLEWLGGEDNGTEGNGGEVRGSEDSQDRA